MERDTIKEWLDSALTEYGKKLLDKLLEYERDESYQVGFEQGKIEGQEET